MSEQREHSGPLGNLVHGRGGAVAVTVLGLLATYLAEQLLTNNPLIYSAVAQSEFCILGTAFSIAAGILIWRRDSHQPNAGSLAGLPQAPNRLRSFAASIPLAVVLVALALVLGPLDDRTPRDELEWVGIAAATLLVAALLTAFEVVPKLRRRFGGLSWRLSASYFVVTLIAASVVAYLALVEPGRGPYVPIFSDILDRLRPARNGGEYFVVLATVIGTVTGVMFARHLTGRFGRIRKAADSWSRGDFTEMIQDPTADELGQLARDLNRMAELLQSLVASREELVAIEERQRLARDLHDSVKQDVYATTLLVGAARAHLPPDLLPAQTYLGEAEALAEQTRSELTALIRALRPAQLAGKGLAAVLRELSTEWAKRTGIGIAVQVAGEQVSSLEVEEALYRVAQEALANVARHSRAQSAALQLAYTVSSLRLVIADDGQGFDPESVSGDGVGLATMRERIQAHGGTLRVISSASNGTVIEASVPVGVAGKVAFRASAPEGVS
jgi:signal transduction histidine kinase